MPRNIGGPRRHRLRPWCRAASSCGRREADLRGRGSAGSGTRARRRAGRFSRDFLGRRPDRPGPAEEVVVFTALGRLVVRRARLTLFASLAVFILTAVLGGAVFGSL